MRNIWILFFLVMVSSMVTGCQKKQQEVRAAEEVLFCTGGNLMLLPLIAREKKYFEDEGLQVEVINLGDGSRAMDTFLAGDCTFGLMADPPVVKQSFNRNDFSIVGTVSSSDASVRILARKKSGIEKPADLKGKKIGVKKGLNSNVYADLFLKKYGLSANDVTYKFMDVKEMPKALLEGKIDAYSASTTYFLEGKRLLGDQSVVFSEPGLYFNSNHMIAKRDFISSKRKVVTKALKAILRAERQVAAAPVEAAKLIAVKMNISEQDATDLLKVEKNQLTLSKDTMRSLIDNADWMLKSGIIENKKTMPDFLKIIDSSLLKEVNTQSVTLQQ